MNVLWSTLTGQAFVLDMDVQSSGSGWIEWPLAVLKVNVRLMGGADRMCVAVSELPGDIFFMCDAVVRTVRWRVAPRTCSCQGNRGLRQKGSFDSYHFMAFTEELNLSQKIVKFVIYTVGGILLSALWKKNNNILNLTHPSFPALSWKQNSWSSL